MASNTAAQMMRKDRLRREGSSTADRRHRLSADTRRTRGAARPLFGLERRRLSRAPRRGHEIVGNLVFGIGHLFRPLLRRGGGRVEVERLVVGLAALGAPEMRRSLAVFQIGNGGREPVLGPRRPWARRALGRRSLVEGPWRGSSGGTSLGGALAIAAALRSCRSWALPARRQSAGAGNAPASGARSRMRSAKGTRGFGADGLRRAPLDLLHELLQRFVHGLDGAGEPVVAGAGAVVHAPRGRDAWCRDARRGGAELRFVGDEAGGLAGRPWSPPLRAGPGLRRRARSAGAGRCRSRRSWQAAPRLGQAVEPSRKFDAQAIRRTGLSATWSRALAIWLPSSSMRAFKASSACGGMAAPIECSSRCAISTRRLSRSSCSGERGLKGAE